MKLLSVTELVPKSGASSLMLSTSAETEGVPSTTLRIRPPLVAMVSVSRFRVYVTVVSEAG